jgi:transcriptional regulator with XRE-family HTH domain
MNTSERRKELADFLKTRRTKLLPSQVDLPSGSRRRVKGLRREEVAELADISTNWYTWLEQGRQINVSPQTLERIAQGLRLDRHETEHLFMLAGHPPPLLQSPVEAVTTGIRHILDSLNPNPAYLVDQRWDLVAWNRTACYVFGNFEVKPLLERNLMWLVFTEPAMRQLFADWSGFARCLLVHFRADYSQSLDDPRAIELAELLQRVSPEFQHWWKGHDVARPPEWRKELDHPIVGRLSLDSTTFQVPPAAKLRLVVYTPVGETNTANKLLQLQK